jgi:hypothetical protein
MDSNWLIIVEFSMNFMPLVVTPTWHFLLQNKFWYCFASVNLSLVKKIYLSSGIWHCIVRWKPTDILKVAGSTLANCFLHGLFFNFEDGGDMSQKIKFFLTTAVRTSDLTCP